MHGNRLADDEAIGHEFADRLARVGIGDFVHFVRIQPDLAFAAAGDRGGEPFLGAKIDPSERISVSWMISHAVVDVDYVCVNHNPLQDSSEVISSLIDAARYLVNVT